MAKFRVGEKVRVTTSMYDGHRVNEGKRPPAVGDVGVVTGRILGYVVVRFDGEVAARNRVGDDGWRFLDEWLEPAQEGPKDRLRESAANTLRFAVGDKVVVNSDDERYLAILGIANGVAGVVEDANRKGGHDYVVHIEGVAKTLFNDAELAPYVEPAKPVAYSVGDRVKVRQAYSHRKRHEQRVWTGVVVERGGHVGVKYDEYDEDDGLAGWDVMSSVEVLEVIAKAKPALLAVGTLVRLTDIGFKRWDASYFHAGSTGTIVGYNNGNDTMPYRVKFDDEPTNHVWNMEPDSIEPVVPGDFRVGDKVRVVKNVFSPTYDYYVGHVGVVRSTINGRGEVDVVFDGLGKTTYCKPEEIELVASNTPIEPYREPAKEAPKAMTTPASEKKREFRVGDKVRLIGRSECCRFNAGEPADAGASGEIIEYEPDSTPWHYLVKLDGDRVWASHKELEIIASASVATPKPAAPTKTIAVSNLRFTRKGKRIVVEANGKRVATVSVEELRKMSDEMTGEDVAQ